MRTPLFDSTALADSVPCVPATLDLTGQPRSQGFPGNEVVTVSRPFSTCPEPFPCKLDGKILERKRKFTALISVFNDSLV